MTVFRSCPDTEVQRVRFSLVRRHPRVHRCAVAPSPWRRQRQLLPPPRAHLLLPSHALQRAPADPGDAGAAPRVKRRAPSAPALCTASSVRREGSVVAVDVALAEFLGGLEDGMDRGAVFGGTRGIDEAGAAVDRWQQQPGGVGVSGTWILAGTVGEVDLWRLLCWLCGCRESSHRVWTRQLLESAATTEEEAAWCCNGGDRGAVAGRAVEGGRAEWTR